MKITFPHMGTSHLALATLAADLGLEPVPPPRTNQRTIALGVKNAPEFACFPLKVNLGNYLEAIEAGAEAILMVGGVGPCRLGYYAEIERAILHRLGYRIELVAMEPPKHHWRELWQAIHRLVPRAGAAKVGLAVGFAYCKLAVLDELERRVLYLRPRERRRGDATKAWQECQALLAPVTDAAGLLRARAACRERLAAIEIGTDRPPLRVALGGEVYMVLEPAVNFDLERVLGEMGVEVRREIFLSAWIRDHLLRSFISSRWHDQVRDLARPYLANFVGGHGLESVAQAVDAGVNKLDGAVQIAPFTCMPEMIAQSILPRVAKDFDLPVMTLILDEHSGEAGVMTRVEAFVDLLIRRRKGVAVSEPVFSGC